MSKVYRNKKTGKIYEEVSFNGTPVAEVRTINSTYLVDVDSLEEVTDMEQADVSTTHRQDKPTYNINQPHSCTAEIIAELERLWNKLPQAHSVIKYKQGVAHYYQAYEIDGLIQDRIKELRGKK